MVIFINRERKKMNFVKIFTKFQNVFIKVFEMHFIHLFPNQFTVFTRHVCGVKTV